MPTRTETSKPIAHPIAPPALNAPPSNGIQCVFCDVEHIVVTRDYQGLAEVSLRLHIAPNGLVENVELLKSSSPEVTEKILPAVRSWILIPKIVNGSPVPAVANVNLKVQAIKPR